VAFTLPTPAEIDDLRARLVEGSGDHLSDAERIDLISSLERLKGAACAAQAVVTVRFDASQRRVQAQQGVPADKQGAGIASQIPLARRESAVKGSRYVGLATTLVREMPHTLRALFAGDINEWRATIVARETATLSAEHRADVDEALAPMLARLGDAGIEREAKKLAYELDPASVLRRVRGAVKDRRVSIRPAPDTMSYLTGFLPVAQGVAVHAALTRHADALRSSGDPRSRGQIMADTLVERVTGQARADAVPVEIGLVMTDRALLGDDHAPARIPGFGPVPAWLGRSLARGADSLTDQAKAWVRRLYTSPTTGELVAMDSRRREFSGGLRHFLVLRDEVCRTPWCDAPIRHVDHPRRFADGGETSAENSQGVCAACNYAKEAPGWSASPTRAGPGQPHTVTTRTPTGHVYVSTAPDPPGRRSNNDAALPQHTERSQSSPSPSRSSDSSWCA
jgi:hypothetical protein